MGFLKRFRSPRSSSKGLSRSRTPPPAYETATHRPTLPPPYECDAPALPVHYGTVGGQAPAEEIQHGKTNAKPRKRDALRKWLKKAVKETLSVCWDVATVALFVVGSPLLLFLVFWEMPRQEKISLLISLAIVVGIALLCALL
ncbi:hypothetical protein BJX68DRAFT_273316 [Aspergillus pseudodeflectus]|uniref:Uncharacterized protein n=1 Tax=Aspergillus pseudodeflectus TaxID=176178 RepID=A0ABR4JA26_9EURO